MHSTDKNTGVKCMSSLLLIIQPVLTFTVPYFRGRGNKEQCFFLQLLLPIAYCLFSTVVPTAAVCAASCEVAYLSIVSVMAKLTPIKARKPSVNRRNEPRSEERRVGKECRSRWSP